jgi:hypothetical protein
MADISGPGALSKRTDLGVLKQSTQPIQDTQPVQSYTGGSYGNNKAMSEQQGSAPLAGNPIQTVSLDSPTQFLDEPLSAGANYGEGPGLDTSHIRGISQPNIREAVYRAMQFDSSGELEAIYNRLNQ